MAKPDEIWIPFGDETAEKDCRGYWVSDAELSRRAAESHIIWHPKGVRVIKVRLVPVEAKPDGKPSAAALRLALILLNGNARIDTTEGHLTGEQIARLIDERMCCV